MSYMYNTEVSCGVNQLADIEDGYNRDHIGIVAFGGYNQAFVIYSDTVENGNGESLTEYIRRYRLGSVMVTPAKENPNSGNTIRTYLWNVDKDKVVKHAEKLGLDPDDYDKNYW